MVSPLMAVPVQSLPLFLTTENWQLETAAQRR
jgi:hypothetical protein